MPPHLLAGCAWIAQFEGVWLVKKFEHLRVMIHDEDRPQLHFVALKLNGDAYFPRWIGSAHVACARRGATNGRSTTNGGEIVAGAYLINTSNAYIIYGLSALADETCCLDKKK